MISRRGRNTYVEVYAAANALATSGQRRHRGTQNEFVPLFFVFSTSKKRLFYSEICSTQHCIEKKNPAQNDSMRDFCVNSVFSYFLTNCLTAVLLVTAFVIFSRYVPVLNADTSIWLVPVLTTSYDLPARSVTS